MGRCIGVVGASLGLKAASGGLASPAGRGGGTGWRDEVPPAERSPDVCHGLTECVRGKSQASATRSRDPGGSGELMGGDNGHGCVERGEGEPPGQRWVSFSAYLEVWSGLAKCLN